MKPAARKEVAITEHDRRLREALARLGARQLATIEGGREVWYCPGSGRKIVVPRGVKENDDIRGYLIRAGAK